MSINVNSRLDSGGKIKYLTFDNTKNLSDAIDGLSLPNLSVSFGAWEVYGKDVTKPVESNFFCLVFKTSSQYIYVVAFGLSTGGVYTIIKINGTWGDWKTI